MIRILKYEEAAALVVDRKPDDACYEAVVRPIIDGIRQRGDDALFEYARKFDGLGESPMLLPECVLAEAADGMSTAIRSAAEKAISNIREFAQAQLPSERFEEFSPGRKLGWIVRPLSAVGCYVPSGRYPLPSTLLMTAVLAHTAGVPRICVTSPKPSPEILGCAHLLGITEVYRVGGAQAIAAMAFGTKTIARVDRIVGPGNAYVAMAKKLVAGDVGIDFVAGPTEILILAADGDPRVIAADMLAQAEHDVTASAMLLTISEKLAQAVSNELEKQLESLPTADVAREAIDRSSFILVFRTMAEAAAYSNKLAPEHLSLHDSALLPLITNAGTVFLGQSSPESAGDYAAGPSHVLPTGGASRLRGGLSTADFVKLISVQQLSPSALIELSSTITTLARAEGLEAHARAVEVRFLNSGTSSNVKIAPKPRQAVLDMAAYHPPTGGRRSKLRLDFNENTVGASPRVIDFLQRYLTAADLSMYPEYENAIEDLAQHFGVSIHELALTNGTDEAIHSLMGTFVEAGSHVLILRPSYAMYRFYAQLAGATVDEIDYRPGTLAFPLEELLQRIGSGTRAVLISNPNNPTGTGVDLRSIEKILDKATNAVVLIDEAYYEFSGVTAMPLIKRCPNLFVSRTFSKTYGLAGMRCGCLFSQAVNIGHVRKAQSPYSVNVVAAMAARIAVQDQKFVEDYVLEVLTARELLYIGFENLNIPYIRSQANFVLFQAGDRAIEIRDELRNRGVLVRDRSYEIAGCVRVTVGTRDQIRRFLDELEQLW